LKNVLAPSGATLSADAEPTALRMKWISITKTSRFDFQLSEGVVKRLQAVRLKLVEQNKNLLPTT